MLEPFDCADRFLLGTGTNHHVLKLKPELLQLLARLDIDTGHRDAFIEPQWSAILSLSGLKCTQHKHLPQTGKAQVHTDTVRLGRKVNFIKGGLNGVMELSLIEFYSQRFASLWLLFLHHLTSRWANASPPKKCRKGQTSSYHLLDPCVSSFSPNGNIYRYTRLELSFGSLPSV